MFLFGGWDGIATLNDLWEYNLKDNTWQEIKCEGEPIKGRYRHTAVVNRSSMFIFGGID